MQYRLVTLSIIASTVIAIHVVSASFYQLQNFLSSHQDNILLTAILLSAFPLYVYNAHIAPRITSFFLFSLYMTAVGMFVVYGFAAWPSALTVAALAAAALAGAAMLALAERQRARRSTADGRPRIPVQRCLLYCGAAVGLSASLFVPMLTLPPLVCAVLGLAGAVAIAAALTAVEYRRHGHPAEGERQAC